MEQISNAITAYAAFTSNKIGKTGLTVTVAVQRVGTNIISVASATAATEVDATNMPGLYSYTLASGSVTVEGEYVFMFRTTDGTVDAQRIWVVWSVGRAGIEKLHTAAETAALVLVTPANKLTTDASGNTTLSTVSRDDVVDKVWDELRAAHLIAGSMGASQSLIGLVGATTTGPYTAAGAFLIFRGNDYYVADNRQLEVAEPAAYPWPSLVGALSVIFRVQKLGGTTWSAGGTATVVNAGVVGSQQVRGVPTSTQTALMEIGPSVYQFVATLASGHVVTLAEGFVRVKD